MVIRNDHKTGVCISIFLVNFFSKWHVSILKQKQTHQKYNFWRKTDLVSLKWRLHCVLLYFCIFLTIISLNKDNLVFLLILNENSSISIAYMYARSNVPDLKHSLCFPNSNQSFVEHYQRFWNVSSSTIFVLIFFLIWKFIPKKEIVQMSSQLFRSCLK